MTDSNASTAPSKSHDHIVRRPRSTDSIGYALRSVFAVEGLPNDLASLVRRIDMISASRQ